jgi:hypothetical protein
MITCLRSLEAESGAASFRERSIGQKVAEIENIRGKTVESAHVVLDQEISSDVDKVDIQF